MSSFAMRIQVTGGRYGDFTLRNFSDAIRPQRDPDLLPTAPRTPSPSTFTTVPLVGAGRFREFKRLVALWSSLGVHPDQQGQFTRSRTIGHAFVEDFQGLPAIVR